MNRLEEITSRATLGIVTREDFDYLSTEITRLRAVVGRVRLLKERLAMSQSDESYIIYRELCDMDLREKVTETITREEAYTRILQHINPGRLLWLVDFLDSVVGNDEHVVQDDLRAVVDIMRECEE